MRVTSGRGIMEASSEKPHLDRKRESLSRMRAEITVPLSDEVEARIAFGSLAVDKEPKRGSVKKQLSVKGKTLCVNFEADEARMLRVSINSFLDHLSLVTDTIRQFGPPVKH